MNNLMINSERSQDTYYVIEIIVVKIDHLIEIIINKL